MIEITETVTRSLAAKLLDDSRCVCVCAVSKKESGSLFLQSVSKTEIIILRDHFSEAGAGMGEASFTINAMVTVC